MAEALEILLPKLIAGRAEFAIINHGSKDQLLKKLPERLHGYKSLSRIRKLGVLVLVDRDDDDCLMLKNKLDQIAWRPGLTTKSNPKADGTFQVVNRIVIEELEAWFFGDIPALHAAYPKIPLSLGQQQKYRDPDAIRGGTWESLKQVLTKAGYFKEMDRLPKIEVARRIAPHMNLAANRSTSFHTFKQGLEALLALSVPGKSMECLRG
ncbi:MAG: DUF4276 family protein [Magnetococcales bacterium]|nr:DUF4276 family protein [Magnetococcales bacterium]